MAKRMKVEVLEVGAWECPACGSENYERELSPLKEGSPLVCPQCKTQCEVTTIMMI